MSISDIIGLPTFPRAYSRGDLAQISELEARGVVVAGFVARVIPKEDGDYHIQITEAPIGRCLETALPGLEVCGSLRLGHGVRVGRAGAAATAGHQ